MEKSKEIPDERMPLPGEPPGLYVRRVLPLCHPAWRRLVESRWKTDHDAGKASAEWPFKAKILRDLVTGVEPPPEESTEPKPVMPQRRVKADIAFPGNWLPDADTETSQRICRHAHRTLQQSIPDIEPLDDRVRDEARRLLVESQKVKESPKTGSLREADGPKSFANIAARVLPNRKMGDDYSAPNNPGDGVRE